MKIVEKYETFDGVQHNSIQSAKRHLANLFSQKVNYVANNIPLGRGVNLAEWIVNNLNEFLFMKEIQDDMELFGEGE